MAKIISVILLAAIVVPAAIGVFILFKNELEIKEAVTGGYGMPVIFGFILIFVVLPIFVFLTS